MEVANWWEWGRKQERREKIRNESSKNARGRELERGKEHVRAMKEMERGSKRSRWEAGKASNNFRGGRQ